MENRFSGIAMGVGGSANPRLALQRLGHQTPRLVVKVDVPKEDADDGLRVCAIDRVFSNPTATFIVFGTPNVSLVMPDPVHQGWNRLAAFMFWRDRAALVRTKGRVQAGVFCELRDISDSARKALQQASENLVGTRKASCAHTTALALHQAGFRSTGTPLQRIYRPSHLVQYYGDTTLQVPISAPVLQPQLRCFLVNPDRSTALFDHQEIQLFPAQLF